MKNKYASNNTPGFIRGLITGTFVIVATFVLSSFAIALIIYNTDDPTAYVELFSIIAFVLSGAAGAFINTRLFGTGGSALSYLSAIFALALFFIISLISGGMLSGGHLLSALCFALVTILSALLAKKAKNSAKRARRKRS